LKNSFIYFISLFIVSTSVFGQPAVINSSTLNTGKLIHIHSKVFIDTTWASAIPPDSVFVYYYSVRAKYPKSSETLREEASDYLLKAGQHFTGSGYVTFRFFIDDTGKMQRRVEVLQTDEFYKEYSFDDQLVWTLFDFLNTLHNWKPAKAPKGYPPFYINLLTFKIHEGNIVNIIP
jgi:hypothetical protein